MKMKRMIKDSNSMFLGKPLLKSLVTIKSSYALLSGPIREIISCLISTSAEGSVLPLTYASYNR